MREIEARLKLSAVDRTAKAFDAVSRRLDQVERQTKQVNRTQAAFARAQGGVALAAGEASMMIGRAIAPAALAYGAAASLTRFAEVERGVERIGITAGATAEQTKAAFGVIDKAAYDYAVSQDAVAAGLDSIVAAGRDMESALSFLPAVTATAQASGAEITDIATTADALGASFKITGVQMQGAFDILVKAGKEGKFELKDMARYIPSMGPAFEALGYTGEAGVMKIAAALQIVRQRTGSSEEAASGLANVIQKMETEDTAKRFKDFGIDLRAEMAKARKEGRDLIDVFVELSTTALKGDLSKLPQLFGDAQVISGMRALILGGDDMAAMFGRLGDAAGETQKDLDRVLGGTQAQIDRMGSSWDRLIKNFGAGVSTVATPAMEALNAGMEADAARAAGYDKARLPDQSNRDVNADFEKRYREIYPDAGLDAFTPWGSGRKAQDAALAQFGRGETTSLYDDLNRVQAARGTSRFPSTADGKAASEAYAARHGGSLDGFAPRTGIPTPGVRPGDVPSIQAMSLKDQYAEYGRGRSKVPMALAFVEDRTREEAWSAPGVDQGSVMPSQDRIDRKRRRQAAMEAEDADSDRVAESAEIQSLRAEATSLRAKLDRLNETKATADTGFTPMVDSRISIAERGLSEVQGRLGAIEGARAGAPVTAFPSAPDSLPALSADLDPDALRRAIEEGGGSLALSGTAAGDSIGSGGDAAAAAISAVFGPGAAIIAQAIRAALAQGVKVNMPAMGHVMGPSLPKANRAPATTMPTAGTPGG